jgi:hypothetical protein
MASLATRPQWLTGSRQGLGVIGRSKEYSLLDVPQVQARLALPPVEPPTHPETGISRALFDCPHVPLGASGVFVRLIVATHPASATPASIGVTRDGVVFFCIACPSSKRDLVLSPGTICPVQRHSFSSIFR